MRYIVYNYNFAYLKTVISNKIKLMEAEMVNMDSQRILWLADMIERLETIIYNLDRGYNPLLLDSVQLSQEEIDIINLDLN